MRLTKKSDYHFGHYNANTTLSYILNKLGQLEDIEDELGVDLITFLKECMYVLDNSNMTTGKMTNGMEITTDYVCDFIREIKEALTKKELL